MARSRKTMDHASREPTREAGAPGLRSLAADEEVVGHAGQGDVGHFGPVLFEMEHVEVAVEEGDVVGRGEDVVHGEPGGPEAAGEPAVAREAVLRELAGDVEV